MGSNPEIIFLNIHWQFQFFLAREISRNEDHTEVES